MTASRPVRWLHLSDLHLGCPGRELWWQVHGEFKRSLAERVRQLGPPDLVLVTGDLAFRGSADDYGRVDRFLDELSTWLRQAGAERDPLVVPVPGNHDLARPEGRRAFPYRVLDKYEFGTDDEDVRVLRGELWEQRDAGFIAELFSEYVRWFERRIRPELEARSVRFHASHFPGDFSLALALPETFPLSIVGLNSAWLQYGPGNFRGKLGLELQQFHAALGGDGARSPLEAFERPEQALLLQHHPNDWFSPRARKGFLESIYTPERFRLCLFGHMHEARSETTAVSGGKPRYYYQAPSLFGLEHYGSAREERAVGYSFGELSQDGALRLWPMKRHMRGGGEHAFVHDDQFEEEPDGRSGFFLHLWTPSSQVWHREEVDLTPYLRDLVEATATIDIAGIGSGAGKVKTAARHRIENLYTPLRSRLPLEHSRGADQAGFLESLAPLSALLPRHERLLIEGQPGSGKTTFLRLVACMLARDALGEPAPDGGSWRRRHLGLDPQTKAQIPILLRISELLPVLEAPGKPHADNRLRLLDLVESLGEQAEHAVPRKHWERLLKDGEAMLLLDGLDEVADDKLRARVFAVLRDACEKWKSPLVVTSRPIETERLTEQGFHLARVEPFGREEIDAFLGRWVGALYDLGAEAEPAGEAGRYLARLRSAFHARPRIRLLADNPVMLTCLCVVHWNEGELPEGRSRVYRAVIKWLLAQRSEQRKAAGYTDRFAQLALAQLALAMMTTPEGKRASTDLETAALAVQPAVAREFPRLADDPEERRRVAREWLRFECLYSGVVQELAGGRLRFWHLTFQEYLAALQLAWRGDGEDAALDWWPLVRAHLDVPQWRETLELFPAALFDEGGELRVDHFFARVLEECGVGGELRSEARAAGLMGRLLAPMQAYEYKPRPDVLERYQRALETSLAIFEPAGAARVPAEERIEVAEALGRAGDPRLAEERDNFLPVPGLEPQLLLGRFPVTVEEYQRFVEARGYETAKVWSAEGWSFRERRSWEAPDEWQLQLVNPNRPVVGVSWYEAEAYCRWLGELRDEDARLPSAEEWLRAASPDGRKYPWGDEEPDEERASFGERPAHPTPVGVYPSGIGELGHLDLGGNVWEWCRDEAEAPWDAEEFGPGRVVRGGCWANPAAHLACAIRGGNHASLRYGAFGFRVALARASR